MIINQDVSMQYNYQSLFPYKTTRAEQDQAIEFALDNFLNHSKKYVIIEAGTGVGKSAAGLTIARYLESKLSPKEEYSPGAYFLTTQKILQDQYIKDFSNLGMRSIKSSSNYRCKFHKGNTCAESKRALKTTEKGSRFWNTCAFNCTYTCSKNDFLESPLSVTNFPYFLAETAYAGKLTPRNVLVVDEAHNVEIELGKFVEVVVTNRFAKSLLKMTMPQLKTQLQAVKWITEIYAPKLRSHVKYFEAMLEKYVGLKEKLKEFATVARQHELLDKHLCKINRFLQIYDKDNWVFNDVPSFGKKSRRLEFKPVDVAPFADEMLFKHARRIIMMSATILDKNAFCEMLGIDKAEVAFISIPSPFPLTSRPIMHVPIGKMNKSEIDRTLPKLAKAVEAILDNHKNQKGIIHCHTFKIARYLKENIKSSRLIIHNSENREVMLQKHIKSKKPTVLLSPSMTEGIDLYDDLSRFQVVCKVPYPFLGDKLVRKRMNKWRWWYPLQTAKSVVQAVGRSVRNEKDHAVTYILDGDWGRFWNSNQALFPPDFKKCMR